MNSEQQNSHPDEEYQSSVQPSTSKNNEQNNDDDDKKYQEEQSSSSSSSSLLKRKIDDIKGDDDEQSDTEVDFETFCCSWNEQIEQVKAVNGILGNSDENNCTYLDDDLIRQPLYACSTCEMNIDPLSSDGEKYMAGICLACTENCHKGHDLFELYTKRNFRCDCGNEKFANLKCKLFEKIGHNETNQYNHNFKGLYCTCELPYPSEDFDDTMIQCGICEDWFHQSHLDVQPIKGYADMICMTCVRRLDFLVYYQMDGQFVFNECDDEETLDKELDQFCDTLTDRLSKLLKSNNDQECLLAMIKSKHLCEDDKISLDKCHTMYLPLDWRLRICRCSKCLQMYNDNGVEYITNPRDMFAVYFHQNQRKVSGPKWNRIQEIALAEGIEHFKQELKKFLDRCQENCKTISAEDVAEFKRNLYAKKRKTIERVQYFCR
ncbi:putative E3 ubiquitin-protein ligase ubr7 [Dermatophagoides farinae]|uniref:E3 ubiquitin-protein ligase ubr7 n=1 Tax=Dermatophagoides farinae TaxID=6954 RepID=A0A922HR68_DERFA|nr:putative E3 ubiquitin-protein ligase ubr7 [Dermatophagoides farinae]